MPHFPHTPEALIGRNDSKNPSTTCKGLTSSGRPCRRALAAPRVASLGRRRANYSALGGVVALVEEDGEVQEADFYCWQHKDQADGLLQEEAANGGSGSKPNKRGTQLYPLKERSSIDTMVQKLGLDQDESELEQRTKTKNPKPPRRTQTTDFAVQQRPGQAPYAEKYNLGASSSRPRPKQQSFWASLCCMTATDDDDYMEIVRHKKRVGQPSAPHTSPIVSAIPARKPVSSTQAPPAPPRQRHASNAETSNLLSLIPEHLPPTTASALLAELTKPISPHDEAGYIYIFWLTPQSKTAPPESTARSLLAPPDSGRRPSNGRRISDVMTEFSFDGDEDRDRSDPRGGASKTIMLKIGRTDNITRRMNEWQRQCGYAMNLVRWYPYVSTKPPRASHQHERQPLYPDLSRPPSNRSGGVDDRRDQVRKVPCVKRVERLIHLELAEKQVKRQCKACGKEHREWFEVEASQAGVQAVDQVVRRWVGWGARQVE